MVAGASIARFGVFAARWEWMPKWQGRYGVGAARLGEGAQVAEEAWRKPLKVWDAATDISASWLLSAPIGMI